MDEVQYVLSRVLLQDFTGVPAVVDIAAMRDAVVRLGGKADVINPTCPVDLVIDHSVQVDKFGSKDAAAFNLKREFERNRERFQFLKWGSSAFKGLRIVPPGSGIVHQVNIEYLARVVFEKDGLLYFDTLVGTDSHTPMANGLGLVAYGVGGIEAEAAMLGTPLSLLLPPVVGVKIVGDGLPAGTTATDLVLTITRDLRKLGVVGKFVEFYGPGVQKLTVAQRTTISNMSPECGSTVGFWPVDEMTLEYLRLTGRSEAHINRIKAYCQATGMFVYHDEKKDTVPQYATSITIDLATIVSCVSGPKRPHDYVALTDIKKDFTASLAAPVGFKGFGDIPNKDEKVAFSYEGKQYELTHGDVVLAAITSCTNTSNPEVLIAAGLLAKKAVEAGLAVKPYIKTSLAPGSWAVRSYLEDAGLMTYLEKLGFFIVGAGCTSCIGNSGPLPDEVREAIEKGKLISVGVLSGNRNFEGRIHSHIPANYLASPPLVVLFALAGRLGVDFSTEAVGKNAEGKDVMMKDIWPTPKEIQDLIMSSVKRDMYAKCYENITEGTPEWKALGTSSSSNNNNSNNGDGDAAMKGKEEDGGASCYPWDDKSTYIHSPPFFDSVVSKSSPTLSDMGAIENARCYGLFGDSVTTDHISPAGRIAARSPAATYLADQGVARKDFNSYGSRRGNDLVMARGTFSNTRIINKFIGKASPTTLHLPSGEEMSFFDAAMKYKEEKTPLIILAGAQYGSGSSRDWAAKGVFLHGVKAVIAVSYERIHRSNLVLFGVLPLQFKEGESAESLGLTGKESFFIDVAEALKSMKTVKVVAKKTEQGGNDVTFEAVVRVDTSTELEYFLHGGVLNYKIRQAVQ